MINLKCLLHYYLPLILVGSCEVSKTDDTIEGLTTKAIMQLDLKFNKYLIIPRSGCGGCIDFATSYIVSRNLRFDSTLIIFTGISNYKELKLNLGPYVKSEIIYIDSVNNFYNPSLEGSIYPRLHFFDGKSWSNKIFEVNDTTILN